MNESQTEMPAAGHPFGQRFGPAPDITPCGRHHSSRCHIKMAIASANTLHLCVLVPRRVQLLGIRRRIVGTFLHDAWPWSATRELIAEPDGERTKSILLKIAPGVR